MAFHDLAREYSTTTGTSDAVLSGAVPGCNTWDDAGVTNAESVKYGIITYDMTTHRPTHSETGTGTYTTSTKTLARTTVISSTNGGSKISLTGLSEVFIAPNKNDFGGAGGGAWALYLQSTGQTVNNAVSGATLEIDSEDTDDAGLASVASDVVTFDANGPYLVTLLVQIQSTGSAFNGRFAIHVADSSYFTMHFAKGYATADGITEDWWSISYFSYAVATDTISATIDNASGVNASVLWQQLLVQQLS